MVHHTSNLVFFFFLPLPDCTVRQQGTLSCLLSCSHCTSVFTSMVEKNSRRVWFGGFVFFTFFFFFPLSICLFVKVLKRWFGFDSFSSQPRKLWDQSAQRLCFSGLLALPCLWGREPRCLLQSPSRMAFLFIGDFKMSLIRISPKFKPSNFSLKQNHLSMQYLCT